jgi:hypothetical protein
MREQIHRAINTCLHPTCSRKVLSFSLSVKLCQLIKIQQIVTYSFLPTLLCYTFWPNWPSSCVKSCGIKESAVLFSFYMFIFSHVSSCCGNLPRVICLFHYHGNALTQQYRSKQYITTQQYQSSHNYGKKLWFLLGPPNIITMVAVKRTTVQASRLLL